jgi:hypothetical protein
MGQTLVGALILGIGIVLGAAIASMNRKGDDE